MTIDVAEIGRRKSEAIQKRQAFEAAVKLALDRHRPSDYELALSAARTYVNVWDGIIAYVLASEPAKE